MGFLHSKGFKYLKNLIIGVGAAVVLVGALYKILSWEGANTMLMIGLLTEAGLFLMLGLLGPEKDYYWEKLYPGLDNHGSEMTPISYSSSAASAGEISFNSEKMEGQLGGMLDHLEVMAGSLSSLKALQEADFSGASDQINKLGILKFVKINIKPLVKCFVYFVHCYFSCSNSLPMLSNPSFCFYQLPSR